MSRQQLLDDPAAAVPQAAQLLAAYFHQDWVDDYHTWEEVVDDVIAESPRALALQAADDIRDVLAAGLDDADLEVVLERVGCSVEPAAFGLTPSGWLTLVAGRLRTQA